MALSRPKKKTYFSFASNGTGPAMRMSFGPQRATMPYKSHMKSGLEVLAKYAAMKPISDIARISAGVKSTWPLQRIANGIRTGESLSKLPKGHSAISALQSPAAKSLAQPAPVSPPASGAAAAADAIRDLRNAAAARPGMSLGGIAKAVGLSGASALAGGGAVAGVRKLRSLPSVLATPPAPTLGNSIDSGVATVSNGINALRQFYGTPAGQMATGGAAALGAYGLARGMLSRPKDEEEAQRGYR